MLMAGRSLTDPPGLKYSALPKTWMPGRSSAIRASRTKGVEPMFDRMEPDCSRAIGVFSHMLKTPMALEQSGSILSNIGSTPLVRLARIAEDLPGIQVFGKAEYFNPGGSVKDRPAMSMILDGERTGKLDSQRTLLDSTSGNTGIAYAMIGAAH